MMFTNLHRHYSLIALSAGLALTAGCMDEMELEPTEELRSTYSAGHILEDIDLDGQEPLVTDELASQEDDDSAAGENAYKLAGCYNPNFSGNPTTIFTSPTTLTAYGVNDMYNCPYGTNIAVYAKKTPPGATVTVSNTSYAYQKRVDLAFTTRAPAKSDFTFCVKVWQNVTNQYLGETCFDRTIRFHNGCEGDWTVSGTTNNGVTFSDTRHGYVGNQGCDVHWVNHTVTGCRQTRGIDGRTASWSDTNNDLCPDRVTVYNPGASNEVFNVAIH